MQAVVEDLRSGVIQTSQVPEPEMRPGGILVRTAFSAISSGTERAKVQASEKSLLGKAMARPDLVKQVVDFARTQGLKAAYEKVQTKLDTLSTMGYSCAGTVISVANDVGEFQIGDRVACGGAGYANHCEINWIPRNLAVKVPDSVSLEAASLTTIGAIAMQGLRQSQISFGETVVVIGSGLLGILAMQLAKSAGCRVIAADIDQSRIDHALAMGAHMAMVTTDPRFCSAVENFSRYGADAVIITAATRSSEPMELAAKIARDRGRIVVVGDVGMDVSRPNMYHKELTLAMSRSYGPGRYDPAYEERGNDYPVGYVRWTERRNMEAILDLLSSGMLDVSTLVKNRYPAREAARAYQDLLTGNSYTAILEYPESQEAVRNRILTEAPSVPTPRRPPGRVRLGCIGAGGFAQSFIFPVLRKSTLVSLESVATASGVTAESARRNYKFLRAQTPLELLQDPNLDAVFIASRHGSHGRYVTHALQSGKAVFVEKPLATSRAELESVRQVYETAETSGSHPFLMVGFNRRFAPFSDRIRRFFEGRREPMLVHARINAGFIPREHWTQQPDEGGRVVGEVCHFVDWARNLIGATIRSVTASAVPDGSRYHGDNVVTTISFADGSIANILYLANGDPGLPKEYFEVFCEGGVARMEDFTTLELIQGRKTQKYTSVRDKGHNEELRLTLERMAAGQSAPIPSEQIFEVMEATFSVAEATVRSQAVPISNDTRELAPAGS